MKPFLANWTLQPLLILMILFQAMAICVAINFIFSVVANKTMPLLKMRLFDVTQVKRVKWEVMGATSDNFVHLDGVRYGSALNDGM